FASLTPPPRLVRCNSTSELRSVSVFSSNCAGVALGAAVAAVAGGGAGVTTAEGADTKGVPLAKGAADEGAGATAGGGRGCRALQISQAISANQKANERAHQGARTEAHRARRNHSSSSAREVSRAARADAIVTIQPPLLISC